MSFQTSFKQILKEKMGEQSSAQTNYSSVMDSAPSHLAYLMGQIDRKEFQTNRGQYPRSQVRPQRKAHNFTAAQKQAFEYLKCWVHGLCDGFTESELRKAFRQTALRLHPDHGGTAQQFIELKESYEILQNVFPSI